MKSKLNEASLSFIEFRHRQNSCPEPPPQAELRPRRLAATSKITTRDARQKQNCCLGSFPQAELRPKTLATSGMAARWLGLFPSILLGHCESVLLPPRIQQRSQVRTEDELREETALPCWLRQLKPRDCLTALPTSAIRCAPWPTITTTGTANTHGGRGPYGAGANVARKRRHCAHAANRTCVIAPCPNNGSLFHTRCDHDCERLWRLLAAASCCRDFSVCLHVFFLLLLLACRRLGISCTPLLVCL